MSNNFKKEVKIYPIKTWLLWCNVGQVDHIYSGTSNYYSNSGVIIDHTIFQFLVELLVMSQNQFMDYQSDILSLGARIDGKHVKVWK